MFLVTNENIGLCLFMFLEKSNPGSVLYMRSNVKFCMWLDLLWSISAVSCSPDAYRLDGVGFGSGMMGKPGRAWVGAGWCMVWFIDNWCVHFGAPKKDDSCLE